MTAAILGSVRERRVFGQRRGFRIAPFLVAYAVAFGVFPFGSGAHYGWAFALAVVAAVGVVAAVALAPWDRLPPAVAVAPLLLYVASIAALGDAHGGAAAGYAPLMIVAALWAAIFGKPWLVAVVVVSIALALALPPVVVGAPAYPPGELRRALLTAIVASLVAAVVQALVRALTTEFERRQLTVQHVNRLRGAEVHDDIVQSIAVAQLGLSVGDRATVDRALAEALTSAQALVVDLFAASGRRAAPGHLRRRELSERTEEDAAVRAANDTAPSRDA